MSKMKMTQREVMESVKEFAEAAGYAYVLVKNIQPDKSSKNWIVEITSGITDPVTQRFMVNDDTKEVSFPAKYKSVPYKVRSEKKNDSD